MAWTQFETNILALTAAIMETFGKEAMRHAAIRAYECETAGDGEGAKTWDLVMHAIVELSRSPRRDREICDDAFETDQGRLT